MPNPPKALFCPTCRKVVLATDADFPFCSDRCRILDLHLEHSDGVNLLRCGWPQRGGATGIETVDEGVHRSKLCPGVAISPRSDDRRPTRIRATKASAMQADVIATNVEAANTLIKER